MTTSKEIKLLYCETGKNRSSKVYNQILKAATGITGNPV
jgi:hypothetical protein